MKVRMKYEKQPFGHSFYKSPSNEMLLKKIQYGKSDRDKQKSFLDKQQNSTKYIPGAGTYKREWDWGTCGG